MNELMIQFDGSALTVALATQSALDKYHDWLRASPHVQVRSVNAISGNQHDWSDPARPTLSVGVTLIVRYDELHPIADHAQAVEQIAKRPMRLLASHALN